jgi:hypothetical protein
MHTTRLNVNPKPNLSYNQTNTNITTDSEPLTPPSLSYLIHNLAKNSGFYIGIPINILSIVFTYNHFHTFVLDTKLIVFNFLVGLCTYGKDHLLDALHSKSSIHISTDKTSMYTHLLLYQDMYREIYSICYYTCLMLLLEQGNAIYFHSFFFYFVYEIIKYTNQLQISFIGALLGIRRNYIRLFYTIIGLSMYQSHYFDHDFLVLPFIVALDCTNSYRSWKVAHPFWKPVYIGAMWTTVTMILPSVLYSNTYSELILHPDSILSPFFLMTGASNMLDIEDIEEDRIANINTFPVVYGKHFAQAFGFICYFHALLFFVLHKN